MIKRSSLDKKLLFGLCMLTVVGILYSKFLLSLTMFGLLILSMISIKSSENKYELGYVWKWSTFKSRLSTQKSSLLIVLLFIMTFFSGVNSDDGTEWYRLATLKLPFLVIPFAFLWYPDFSFTDRKWAMLILSSVLCISSLPVLIQYGLHYEEYTLRLGKGIPIPTPLNHIKYSLLMTLVCCFNIILWIDHRYQLKQSKWLRYLCIFTALLLFAVIHLLAVRTGIIALYIGLTTILLFGVLNSKRRKWIIPVFLFLAVFATVSVKYIPSLKNKISYSLYDIKKYKELKDASNYSLAARLYSYEAGLNLVKANPILGIGVGDVKSSMKKQYREVLSISQGTDYPHNQYLLTAVGMGVLGLVVFLIALLVPFVKSHFRSDLMVWCFLTIMLSAFMIDNILERAASIAYYIYLYCLLVKTKETR